VLQARRPFVLRRSNVIAFTALGKNETFSAGQKWRGQTAADLFQER
jgi:hypothetical protein